MTVKHPQPGAPVPCRQPDRPAAPPDLVALRSHFLAILPRIELHATISFRGVACPGRRDDLIAETVAVAWRWFLRLAERGKGVDDFVMALADLAVRHVRSGRRLCRQESAKDVLSCRAQWTHNFTVQSLPEYESGVEGNEVIDALRDNTRTPPPEQAAFRIDYPAWLSRLGRRNRRIAEDMATGEGTQQLARKHKLSQSRISQLRRELHQDWRRFHGEIA